MKITIRTIGKCKVLDCSGPITLGPASLALRKAIREAVQGGTSKVVLNLNNVDYMDSIGIGELVSSYVHVKNQGSSLPLLNLDPKVHKLLAIANLLVIFDVFDDEQKALEGCK